MKVDVAVLGGGPAGTACALTLRRYSDLRVAVIERGDYSGVRVGETIGPGVRPLLAYLGLWEKFIADGHRRAHATAAAWGSNEVFRQEFFFTGRGEGWHLDRCRFDRMLALAVKEAGGRMLSNCAFRSVARGKEGWLVAARHRDGRQARISARFVIDATGRAALVARRLGAQPSVVDRLVGVTGFMDFPQPFNDEHFALVEACRDGWWYSACLPQRRMAVTFMSDPEIVRELRAQHVSGWSALLASTRLTRARVGNGSSPGTLFARTAGSQWLRPAGGDRWLAVGDAAAAFDPLSSMGIGHALSTGMHAARAANAALEGDNELLNQYSWSVAENFERFLKIRRSFYAAERRWIQSPFWRCRQAGARESIGSIRPAQASAVAVSS
ncbi:MAG TPA: tryptophan 7-halogenase [Chthoniobacterales bacterium]|nr:tryptophan 7-halogenase [Chthoniobacterales bacterium]